MSRALGSATGLLVLAASLFGLGCGGAPARYRAGAPDSSSRSSRGESFDIQMASTESTGSGDSGGSAYDFDEDTVVTALATGTSGSSSMEHGSALEQPPQPPADRYAQAETSRTTPEATATDAVDTSRELLIYTAVFHVGVYDVAASQALVAESARAAGGFVFQQADDHIVVRVPAARFRAFVETVEGVGDVLHRQIDAQDVGEEFRDVDIRIRNLEAVRDRIAALLERGLAVEQVLVVERELERVTGELERMRGRQRYLSDRIAYSTITVLFRPAPREQLDQPDVFQLPFSWLDSLGLSNLLNLR